MHTSNQPNNQQQHKEKKQTIQPTNRTEKNTAQDNTVQQNTGNEKQEKTNNDTKHSGEFKEQEKIALPGNTISIEMTSLKNNTTNQTSSSTHPVLTSSTATTLNNHFEDSEHLRSTSTDTISTSVRSGLSFYKGTPYIRRDSRSGKYSSEETEHRVMEAL